ncbi:hypothetical protein OPT61_g7093 [Boeremia exigua]|uniref:Uncharacterized protein n=1 Tax=Boeremia exigua TaxID=749465 RepID=A0ACC2I3Z1_9PLEO|nr:hypothetical protein OPT61_g7093 [Boeremia exigua]
MSSQDISVNPVPTTPSFTSFSHNIQQPPTAAPVKRGRGRPPVHKKDANGRPIVERNPDGSRVVPVQKYEMKVRAGGSQSSRSVSRTASASSSASTSASNPAKTKGKKKAGGTQSIKKKPVEKKKAARSDSTLEGLWCDGHKPSPLQVFERETSGKEGFDYLGSRLASYLEKQSLSAQSLA